MILRFFRNFPHRRHEDSGRERFFRNMLLLCLIGLVGWGFWTNSERRFAEIALQGIVRDSAGVLTQAEKKHIAAHAQGLFTKYGIRVEVAVLAPSEKMAHWDGKSVLLVLAPAAGTADLQLPPLVRRAMDTASLPRAEALMRPYFEKGQWQEGIRPVLSRIDEALAVVTR